MWNRVVELTGLWLVDPKMDEWRKDFFENSTAGVGNMYLAKKSTLSFVH